MTGQYWYNYNSWATAFSAQFGAYSYTYSFYISIGYTIPMDSLGTISDSSVSYDLERNPVNYYLYYYVSGFRTTSLGTADYDYPDYDYTTYRNSVVHRDNPSTGSQAMAWAFDLSQISGDDNKKNFMRDVLEYFGLDPTFTVEINEGDEIELADFKVSDPALGEPTEPLTYRVDWGDGEWGPLMKTTGTIGRSSGHVYAPSQLETVTSGTYWAYPFGTFFGRTGGFRYQVFIPSSDMDGVARSLTGLSGKRIFTSNTWTNHYKDFDIYMSHLSSSTMSTTFASNYGTDRTLVFSKASFSISSPAAGERFIDDIVFDKAFNYDGSSNVVVEISYNPDTTKPTNTYPYLWIVSDGSGQTISNNFANPAKTATTGTKYSYQMGFRFSYKIDMDPAGFTHLYRDDPAGLVNDIYKCTVHVYDDDLGEGTYQFNVKVNNIKPTIDKADVALGNIVGQESGTPSVVLPSVDFTDPGTQYDVTAPNEVWTYWWDLDNNQIMNNAPDVIGTVPQSLMDQSTDTSDGSIPSVKAMVNDDMLNEPIALYLLDDDMMHHISSGPSSATGTITVNNVAPVASIEVYIPMEVRVRMTGRLENDVKIEVRQTSPRGTTFIDEMIIERMPGQPKDNPFGDGTPSVPMFVKADPSNTVDLIVTFDANPDANDVANPDDPTGSNPVWVYLDFPLEEDYEPRDDDQSSTGHHWAQEHKFNVQQDGTTSTETTNIDEVLKNRWAWLIGHSNDDASDDAAFYWGGVGALSYYNIVYYNDGSDAQQFSPPAAPPFTDGYPTPWTGTAPCHYMDIHLFKYVGSGSVSVSLYTEDDDGGVSNTATYSV
jgi:hypothetical protein